MGSILLVLLALAAQALAESGLESGDRLPWAVPLLAAVPYVLARLARRASLQGRFRRAALLARVTTHSPAFLHLAAIASCGWRLSVEAWLGVPASLFEWPTFGLLLSFAPFALYGLAAIDAQARARTERGAVRRSLRRFQVRMFLSGLLPVCAYVVLASLVGLDEGWRVQVEEVALWNGLFTAGLFALFAAFVPTLLRNVWETAPVPPGPQRELLERTARAVGFESRDLLVWKTGHMVANAAIVGVTPRDRVVLFSDSLLGMLSPRELVCVFAHEIGHAKRHHVLIFLSWAAGFFLLADLGASRLDPDQGWLALVVMGAALGLWFLGFGWLSRRFELEADLYSVTATGDPEGMVSALEAVGGELRDVAGWRHFSVTDRAAFLWRVVAEPKLRERFLARLRRFAWTGAALFVVAVGLQVLDAGARFEADRLVADLRLGRYASARARVEAAGGAEAESDERWQEGASLAARTGELGLGDPRERAAEQVEPLLDAARAALERGDGQAALECAVLAGLVGDARAAALADVLGRRVEGERGPRSSARQRERLDADAPGWWGLVEAALPARTGGSGG